ncbi:hypothetical protein GALL_540420 [mine drainage metagenome]|uniref:Uncharacterized protein n=1 Tax=mine drainage metagenome TaxID=410659 RepID=A0A1J5P1E8_9ZZZZ
MDHAEAVVERFGQQPRPGGGAHQREGSQVHVQGLGAGALADENVQLAVLHGGVEHLLNGRRKAVDLVNEEELPCLQVGEDGRQVTLLLQRRRLDHLAGGAHLVGQHVGQGGLAEAGRAEEQHVIEHLAPLLGGAQGDLDADLHLVLADIFLKPLGPEGIFHGIIGR